jgi:hypothetical protein
VRVPDLLSHRRTRLVGGGAVVVALLLAVAMQNGAERDEDVVSGDRSTTTSTVTTTEGSTTSDVTTTSTTEASAVTSTTAPPVVATDPPAPAPPTTRPAPTGTLDLRAVVAFAKSHRPDTPPAQAYSGGTCERSSEQINDAGDDNSTDGDITYTSLVRDCLGTYRLFPGAAYGPFDAYWIEIDGGPGGCGGVDVVGVMWSTADDSMLGAVVRTTGCQSDSWAAIDTTGNIARPGKLLDIRGSTFGDPTRFGWRAGLLGANGDPSIDLAPNTGFASFQR